MLGVDADVYFTGEMSHVRLSDDHEVLGSNLCLAQHEVLAAVASGRNVILCKSSDRPLRKEFSIVPSRRTHEHRAGLPSGSRLQTADGARES